MIRRLAFAITIAAVLGGCASGGLVRTELEATLTGYQVVPGPGDLDGTGTALVRADPANGRICWTLAVRGIDGVTGAAIRRAEAGATGPVVVPLSAPDAGGRSEGCVDAGIDLAREFAAMSHLFYVDVATAAFPGGAVRGQLRGGFNPRALRPDQSAR